MVERARYGVDSVVPTDDPIGVGQSSTPSVLAGSVRQPIVVESVRLVARPFGPADDHPARRSGAR